MPIPMRRLLATLSLAVLLAGCTPDETEVAFPNQPSPSPSRIVTPLPSGATQPPAASASPGPARASGAPSHRCEEGWETPSASTRDRAIPIRVILDRLEVDADPVVVEMRMFDGPESPPSDKGYIANVRRWYVKLTVPGEPGAQGRFLVEDRTFGTGLVAVAPFRTEGFTSPDWVGFQFDPVAPALAYPDLPGTWRGVPYDFVEGGEGLTIPGLPNAVAGCLEPS